LAKAAHAPTWPPNLKAHHHQLKKTKSHSTSNTNNFPSKHSSDPIFIHNDSNTKEISLPQYQIPSPPSPISNQLPIRSSLAPRPFQKFNHETPKLHNRLPPTQKYPDTTGEGT
jgi:hypothetical protein